MLDIDAVFIEDTVSAFESDKRKQRRCGWEEEEERRGDGKMIMAISTEEMMTHGRRGG